MARVRRHFLVNSLYAQYLFNQIPLIEWKFMPQVYSVCRLPELAALVEADRDRAITLADFAACMDGLGKSLSSAYEETRTRLRVRVLAANDPFFDSDLTETQRFMDLELVFRCGRCKYGVFGWDDIRSHRCDEFNFLGLYLNSHPQTGMSIDDVVKRAVEFPHTYKYWERGSVALRRVIESLGMDPKTTTAAQLDANPDMRLECHCSGSDIHCAHKWRMLVRHATPLAAL